MFRNIPSRILRYITEGTADTSAKESANSPVKESVGDCFGDWSDITDGGVKLKALCKGTQTTKRPLTEQLKHGPAHLSRNGLGDYLVMFVDLLRR